ncbi:MULTISPECIES: MFS transporter [unclassified Moraxella]|uniref:MFS transporter n=1 Tax=unclassified Moraxella TaxID=2685852 RepID=UPI003AF4D192
MSNELAKDSISHYKTLGLLLTLYFAQGLPAGFITQALPAILRQYQVSLVAIGWSGLILIPWGLKFLWATFVDGLYSDRVGRSRSWILPMQMLSIAVLVAVAFFEPHNLSEFHAVVTLYSLLFCLSLIGATHDVATDGLATRLLKAPLDPKEPLTHEVAHAIEPTLTTQPSSSSSATQTINHQHRQSQGNAIQVIGYRMGLIIGGGVLLMFLDKLGWQTSFLAMAGLVVLNTIPILLFKEPKLKEPTLAKSQTVLPRLPNTTEKISVNFQTVKNYINHHYSYFWSNREMQAWLMVLLVFKVADGISSGMVKPMMVDIGVNLQQIGFWATILGSGASLLGAGVATVLMKRLSRFRALLLFNFCQAITTGLYGLVAYGFYHHLLSNFAWLYAINALEHFCASLALIAMLTTIMHYARHEQAGSDFTVQVCLLTVLGGSAHFASGYMAHYLGYVGHFGISMLIGFICLLPIAFWHKLQK